MSEQKNSFLPRLEMIIIGIFLLSFMVWSVSKCTRTRNEILQDVSETEQIQQQATADSLARIKARKDSLNKARKEQLKRKQNNRYTPLFVTIDDLNVRTDPDLKADVVDQLTLFEEVEFLNEWTDFTTEVNLGKAVANEPWIKVRTPKGHEGWVYGAGVHYYKQKNPGVY